MSEPEVLRELWKIVEWRDGCPFNSQSLGHVWVPLGLGLGSQEEAEKAKDLGGDFLTSISSNYTGPRCRRPKGDGTYTVIY